MAKRKDDTITIQDLDGEFRTLLAARYTPLGCLFQLWHVLVIKDEAYSQQFHIQASDKTKVYTDLSPAIRQFNHLVTGEGWQ